jgi:hypothetical protein
MSCKINAAIPNFPGFGRQTTAARFAVVGVLWTPIYLALDFASSHAHPFYFLFPSNHQR